MRLRDSELEDTVPKRRRGRDDRTLLDMGPARLVAYRAVAGHGKTSWLSESIRLLTRIQGVPPEHVIGFSYTRSASETLHDRIYAAAGVRVDVQTMHAWCNRFLAHTAETITDGLACVHIMVKEVVALAEEKETQRALADYHPRQYIFVDEGQDCNTEQFRLISLLRDLWGATLVLVGDAAQSIYSFQGARPDLFNGFICDNNLPADLCIRIDKTENYRNPPAIIAAANANAALIDGALQMVPGDPDRDPGSKPRLLAFRTQEGELQRVCARVNSLIEEGVAPCEIVVLSRCWGDLLPLFYQMVVESDIDAELKSAPVAREDGDPEEAIDCSSMRVQLRTVGPRLPHRCPRQCS
jgi:superfamily I DNA/RNA helicase